MQYERKRNIIICGILRLIWYYIPSVGRWAAEDPLGFWGGTTNFYAYATSDPVNFGGADDFLKGSYKGRMTFRVFAISDGGKPRSDDDSYPPGWDTGRGFTPEVPKNIADGVIAETTGVDAK